MVLLKSGGLAQVGGKAQTSSAVQFSPHLRQAARSLPAFFGCIFAVLLLAFRLYFICFGSFLPLKTLIFTVSEKSYQQSVFFIFIFLIFCVLRPLSRSFLCFLSTLFRQAFRRSGRGKKQPEKAPEKKQKTKEEKQKRKALKTKNKPRKQQQIGK